MLQEINNKINSATKGAMIIIFALMVLVSFSQVVYRYYIKQPLIWSEELARYLFVWLTFLGTSVAYKEKALAYVEAFITILPKRLAKLISQIVNIIILGFCFVMLYYGFVLVTKTMEQLSPAMMIPMGFVYLAVPVSGFLMLLYTLECILQNLKQ